MYVYTCMFDYHFQPIAQLPKVQLLFNISSLLLFYNNKSQMALRNLYVRHLPRRLIWSLPLEKLVLESKSRTNWKLTAYLRAKLQGLQANPFYFINTKLFPWSNTRQNYTPILAWRGKRRIADREVCDQAWLLELFRMIRVKQTHNRLGKKCPGKADPKQLRCGTKMGHKLATQKYTWISHLQTLNNPSSMMWKLCLSRLLRKGACLWQFFFKRVATAINRRAVFLKINSAAASFGTNSNTHWQA